MGLRILTALLLAGEIAGAQTAEMPSWRATADFPLTADPGSSVWKRVRGVAAAVDRYGKAVPGHRTEVRSRWTDNNIYFLFVCPYEQLNLKPDPRTDAETNRLWEWDVAEVFIGWELDNIHRYKEFEISPQGEWIDLDIDRARKPPLVDWTWNSGFEAKTHIDREQRIWYGEMRIPLKSIDTRKPRKGLRYRLNLYRIQGAGENRRNITWQPVHAPSYHTPERFGSLVLK